MPDLDLVVVIKTVQRSWLCVQVAVLAAGLCSTIGKEQKMLRAPKVTVVVMLGNSLESGGEALSLDLCDEMTYRFWDEVCYLSYSCT